MSDQLQIQFPFICVVASSVTLFISPVKNIPQKVPSIFTFSASALSYPYIPDIFHHLSSLCHTVFLNTLTILDRELL